jgi:hypothetical protein
MMKPTLVIALIVGFTAVVHAGDKSIEVTLEVTPPEDPQGSQLRSFEEWRRKPAPQEVNSDGNGAQWIFKFDYVASDKRLGSAADTASITALVPVTTSPTIRWVSRSVVVVSSACRSNVTGRCLYVLERHGSKWKLTHHYYYPPPHPTF